MGEVLPPPIKLTSTRKPASEKRWQQIRNLLPSVLGFIGCPVGVRKKPAAPLESTAVGYPVAVVITSPVTTQAGVYAVRTQPTASASIAALRF